MAESDHSASMNTMPSFLRRDVASIKPWTETCGQIRPLIEEEDGPSAEVHHLEITDAKLHYHNALMRFTTCSVAKVGCVWTMRKSSYARMSPSMFPIA